MAYINKKEQKALNMARDQITTIVECCSTDEDSKVIKDLNYMLEVLSSLYTKSFKQ